MLALCCLRCALSAQCAACVVRCLRNAPNNSDWFALARIGSHWFGVGLRFS